jgi:hypothetical protein
MEHGTFGPSLLGDLRFEGRGLGIHARGMGEKQIPVGIQGQGRSRVAKCPGFMAKAVRAIGRRADRKRQVSHL